MFEPLNLGADVGERCLALALEWFKREGADTVADLCELPAGACKKFVDSLGLPPLKAQKLPEALEGASLAHEPMTLQLGRLAMCGDVRWQMRRRRRRPSWRLPRRCVPSGQGGRDKGACVAAGVWEWVCLGLSGSDWACL